MWLALITIAIVGFYIWYDNNRDNDGFGGDNAGYP